MVEFEKVVVKKNESEDKKKNFNCQTGMSQLKNERKPLKEFFRPDGKKKNKIVYKSREWIFGSTLEEERGIVVVTPTMISGRRKKVLQGQQLLSGASHQKTTTRIGILQRNSSNSVFKWPSI